MKSKTTNKGKEYHHQQALGNSPLRIIQGDFMDLPDDERQTIKKLDEDFSLRVLIEAESYYQLNAYRMAIKLLETYTKLYPDNHYAWNRLGTAYSALDEQIKALYCYEKAYKASPNERDFVLNFATELIGLGKDDQAQELLTNYFYSHPCDKLYIYFHWYEAEYPMSVVKNAWRARTKHNMKVVNGKSDMTGFPIDEGQNQK